MTAHQLRGRRCLLARYRRTVLRGRTWLGEVCTACFWWALYWYLYMDTADVYLIQHVVVTLAIHDTTLVHSHQSLPHHLYHLTATLGAVKLPKSRYGSISTYIYHCKGDSHCHRTFEVRNRRCNMLMQLGQQGDLRAILMDDYWLNLSIDANLASNLINQYQLIISLLGNLTFQRMTT